jgi:hypothetical protein
VKATYILQPAPHPARKRAMQAVGDAPEGYCVTVSEPNRNLDQNAAMWPCLQAFSEQLEWPVNGAMSKLTPEEWKTILSAAWRRESVRVAPGIDGGMVMLGERTSKLSKREFSELLDFIHATAAARGVELQEVATA